MENYNTYFDTDIFYEDTDPEYAAIVKQFAFEEVPSRNKIDPKTRYLCILATLLGCQAFQLFKKMLPAAMKAGLSPVEIKEIVYQGTDYLGMARVYPFIDACNEVFKEMKIELPLQGQATTSKETRLQDGNAKQIKYFGQGLKESWTKAPKETAHIQYWLADNCFGDYYTRNGLSDRLRELITFCFLAAQGGCEPQLTGHAAANMGLGNDREFLIEVVSQNLPYIGYPRSLNALTCIENALNYGK